MSGVVSPRKFARFTVDFVTPCFLSGADGKTAEWRSTSIRGQLRWWLRAIAPGNLGHVRELEERIFGSTSQQSNVVVLVSESPPTLGGGPCRWGMAKDAKQLANAWKDSSEQTIKRLTIEKSPTSNAIHYLGYGPILWIKEKKQVEITRSYIAPTTSGHPSSFELRWSRLSEECERLLLAAVAAWLHLGGIGARSRRGFGSLRCVNVERNASPVGIDFRSGSRDALKTNVQDLLKMRGPEAVKWSRLGADAHVYLGSSSSDTWEGAMSSVGSWMIAFRRRYGSPLDKRKVPEEKGPGLDYAWAAKNGTQRRQGFPDRAGFGLPLPFGKLGDAETIVWGDADHDNRRASPMLVHIAKLAEREYLPVLTHLPAPLIPDGEKLLFKKAKDAPASQPPSYDIVKTFLRDLEKKELVEMVE